MDKKNVKKCLFGALQCTHWEIKRFYKILEWMAIKSEMYMYVCVHIRPTLGAG